jgi:hypothetical protein
MSSTTFAVRHEWMEHMCDKCEAKILSDMRASFHGLADRLSSLGSQIEQELRWADLSFDPNSSHRNPDYR